MKNTILFLIITFFPLVIFAQKKTSTANFHRCYTYEKMQELRALDPSEYDKNKAKQERIIQNWIAKKYQPNAKVIYTIPVVVQIFGSTPNSAVTDNRVYEQIDVLTKDYRRFNSDTNQTPAAFKSIAADCEIEFCLATLDPQGNATTGIVRNTGSTQPTTSDLWNTSQYLNLLVYNLGGGLLGYTYLPSQAPNNGVHIGYQYFGKTGASAPFNKGRTASHEIGHWFNLEHIWADESSCNADDGVSDTPQQKGENYGCPSYPQTTQAGGRCSTNDPSSMFMDYMDYTDDGCMNMFSAGQKARMISAINQYRPGLLNNGKCGTGAPTDDAGITSITQPSGNICSSSIAPVIVLKNFGTQILTTCTISYKIDSNTPATYSWTGTLANNATANVTLPSMAATGGIHTFTVNTVNPNGNTDSNTSNDQATGSFSISNTGQSMPFTEGFEGSFIPTGWTLNNSDASTTWAKATVGYSGSASAFMDNYDYNASGQVDEMVSPAVDLTSGTNPTLTFQLAYRLYTNPADSPNWADTLEVLISTDCGITYSSLYKKFSSTLTTVTPVFSTTEFVPSGTGDWRMETISLANYVSVNNAIFKFRHATDYENDLYVDDINITGGPGCSISVTTSVTNPACGQSNGSIAASATGGTAPYSYLWSNGQTGATATGLAAGNYTVSVTDANNCVSTLVASLSNTNAPVVIAGSADASSFGACDGAGSANATGGTSPYTYLWSNGDTTANITGLCAGTYNVTVTDAASCAATASVVVSQPAGINGLQVFGAEIKIFPNPNNGKFTLETHNASLPVSINIYNVLGEKIKTERKEKTHGEKINIDLSNEGKGIYFVEISTSEKTVVKKVSLIK